MCNGMEACWGITENSDEKGNMSGELVDKDGRSSLSKGMAARALVCVQGIDVAVAETVGVWAQSEGRLEGLASDSGSLGWRAQESVFNQHPGVSHAVVHGLHFGNHRPCPDN